MELNLLLRLLVAHLLTDFVFQSKKWVKDKEKKKIRSSPLYLHVLLTAVVAYIFSGLYSNLWIPLIILITHFLIDLWKLYRPNNFVYFVIDQVLHFLVILGIWMSIYQKWPESPILFEDLFKDTRFWIYCFSYLVVMWPLGILIGKATEVWRKDLEHNEEQRTGLANAGKWIGLCERVLILTFVLTNQFTAIGFLITAKSILRFSDKDSNTQKRTEYVLIGTLMSFAASAGLGLLVAKYLHLY